MEAFDWINDTVRWFAQFFPRWDLCEPTEGGVKFRGLGKKRIKLLEPGKIYFWWPVSTVVYTIDTKRQTLTITQRLTTKDNVTVMVTTVIVYTIIDVTLALVETRDFEDTISEVGEKLVVKPIMSRDFEQIRVDLAESNELNNEVKRNARSMLSEYGVGVEDGFVSNFTETRVFSHDGDGFAFGGAEDEDE